MRKIEIIPHGFPIKFREAKPGIVISPYGNLIMITEYHNKLHLPEAYCVESGEAASMEADALVQPCIINDMEQ